MLDLDTVFNADAVEAAVRVTYGPPIGPGDLPLNWRVEWEERAAVKEYCGGMPRADAEAAALAEIVRLMGA